MVKHIPVSPTCMDYRSALPSFITRLCVMAAYSSSNYGTSYLLFISMTINFISR